MEELSRECLMETLDVFSGLKRIGGSEDEHRACGYLIKKLQEWGIPCRVYECDGYVSTPIEASVTVEGMDQTFESPSPFLLRPLSGRSDRPLVL